MEPRVGRPYKDPLHGQCLLIFLTPKVTALLFRSACHVLQRTRLFSSGSSGSSLIFSNEDKSISKDTSTQERCLGMEGVFSDDIYNSGNRVNKVHIRKKIEHTVVIFCLLFFFFNSCFLSLSISFLFYFSVLLFPPTPH
jgi:hypothetical protein